MNLNKKPIYLLKEIGYFSFQHDSFFLIYIFVIYNKLKDINDEDVIKYNSISKELLKMNLSDLNKGIWSILKKFKSNNFDLTKNGYKPFYTVMQHILKILEIKNIFVSNTI